MKYRTLIELVCDAADRDEAFNTAGDFLSGKIDFGVEMKCATSTVKTHRIKKCAAVCLVAFLVSFTLFLSGAPSGENNRAAIARSLLFQGTSTVVPSLKTSDTKSFQNKWESKKEEAVLDFLKND